MCRKSLQAGVSALVLGAALTTAAVAADMPLKAPPPMAAPITDWTGIYAGGAAGGIWNRPDTWTFVTTGEQTHPPGSGTFAFAGFTGFNFQFGSFVFGPEASAIAIGRLRSSAVCVSGLDTCHQSLGSAFTAGGRAGFAFNSWMVYGGGGFATAHIGTSVTRNATGLAVDETGAFHPGWYAGGGVDWAFSPIIRFGVDYKHMVFRNSVDPSPPLLSDSRTVGDTADMVLARITIRTWVGGY